MPTAQALDFQARTHTTPRYATTAPQIRTAARESRVRGFLDRPRDSRTHGKPKIDFTYADEYGLSWPSCFPAMVLGSAWEAWGDRRHDPYPTLQAALISRVLGNERHARPVSSTSKKVGSNRRPTRGRYYRWRDRLLNADGMMAMSRRFPAALDDR